MGHKDPAGGERSRDHAWGDPQARDLVRRAAADIASVAGCETCVVEVVRPDGQPDFVAVAGTSGGFGRGRSSSLTEEARRVIGERSARGLFTEVRGETESPEDVSLVAQVLDEQDDILAWVHLDLAPDAPSPSDARLQQVAGAVSLSMRSLLIVIEHERFAQRIRTMAVVRRLLHSADVRDDEDALVRRAVDELGTAFDATAFEIHLFGEAWTGPLSQELDPGDRDSLAEAAERACAEHTAVVIEPGDVWGDEPLRDIEPALTAMLDKAGASSAVLAPIGAAGTAMGLMLIARGSQARRWTDPESAAAVDFGHDLGRTIINARATRRAHDLLEQLRWHESLRRSFISTITHELKTPLTVIRANAELLGMAQDLAPAAARKLHAIELGAERLTAMVHDLTTLAKVTDPRHDRLHVTVDLAAVLQDVLMAMEAVADRGGVVVELEEPTDDSRTTGDPGELASALTNVVDNAVKYSDAGGRIRVSLHREGPWIVFSCRDEGLGISEEDQATLFTPFFRSSNPDALARPGSGLGLEIVRSVVERHGGQVVVESVLGEGTTLHLRLPALDQEPRDHAGDECGDEVGDQSDEHTG